MNMQISDKSDDARPHGRRRRMFLAAGLAVALAIGGVALADDELRGGGPHGGMHGGIFGGPMFRILRLVDSLNLTEEQEVKAVRIRRNLREEGRNVRKNLHEAMGGVLEELGKAKPDVARLHKLVDERNEEMRKLMHRAVDEFATFHATLDAKQRETLVERAKDMHDDFSERVEKRQERKGPKGR